MVTKKITMLYNVQLLYIQNCNADPFAIKIIVVEAFIKDIS